MEYSNGFKGLEKKLLDRFLTYTGIDTTSSSHSKDRPSTKGQLELAGVLMAELKELNVDDVTITEHGFIIARIPGNPPAKDNQEFTVGFMAHLDTSESVTGKNVKPMVHSFYNGGPIILKEGYRLDPEEYPRLLDFVGDTIITSNGTTLLGADDKAGIAEIMTAVEYLLENPEIPRPVLEIIFTPDEETGFGMDLFPVDRIKSNICYTVDGSEEGSVESECFEAYRADAAFHGKSIHLGRAKGRLVNALSMAANFITLLPRTESPEATEGREGYYCPLEMSGNIESARVSVFVRDFEESECLRRIETLKQLCKTIEMMYHGGKAAIEIKKQYSNMRNFLENRRKVLTVLEEAIRETGIEPERKSIRGGTDGARLSEMGIPTPNMFTGGFNFHSKLEWIPISSMVKAAITLVNLAKHWFIEENK
ncbi:MAG: peptidase T [Spirochaetales bacterium]|nr:peptidase T [Spirochaetales bacterium]